MRARIHASCVVVGEAGILVRGPSGAGKSRLAFDLLWEAGRLGAYAALVGDDRVEIEACHGRLVARALPAIAGLLEVRGIGPVAVEPAPGAVLGLVVDCLREHGPRMPEPGETTTTISGITVPRIGCIVEPGLAARILLPLVARMTLP